MVAAFLGLLSSAGAAAGLDVSRVPEGEVVTVNSRGDVTLEVLMTHPKHAKAILVMLEGGGGHIRLRETAFGIRVQRSKAGRGFLVRARFSLARNGIATALVDAPSDNFARQGVLQRGFLRSQEHMEDISAVIRHVRNKTGLPVWLAGVSIGSIRASLYPIGGYEPIDGLVLASAPTNPSRGIGIDKFVSLSRLRIPFLIVGHAKDECPGTPAEGAQKIVEVAVNAVDRRVMIFDGGENEGNHVCKPFTPHTFYGIEDEVGAAIANYMMANLPQ